MISMERSRKRPRSNSEYSNSVIKRTGLEHRVPPFSSEQQTNISRAASNLQVPSQVVPRAFGQSSPSTHPGENFYLTTQEVDQTPQTPRPSSTTYFTPFPEQHTQHPAISIEELPAYDTTPTATMYGPAISCLPEKYFGFAATPLQWSDCFASFAPIRHSLTNQPGTTGGYRDASTDLKNGVPVPEKTLIASSGTNSPPFQPYSDDAPIQMPESMAQVQGDQFFACDDITAHFSWQSRYPALQPMPVQMRQPVINPQNMTYSMESPYQTRNVWDHNAYSNMQGDQLHHANQGDDSPVCNRELKNRCPGETDMAERTVTRREFGPARRRGFQNVEDRVQTAQTRKDKACLRCRMQKVRCLPDPSNPQGVCLTCQKVTSMKVSTLPCVRYKITEIRLFKPGPVPGLTCWTERWLDKKVTDICEWKSPTIRKILTTEGFSSVPMELEVREFLPQKGDVVERHWYTRSGLRKSVNVPCYAIANINTAQKAYVDYINTGGAEFFEGCLEDRDKDSMIRKTYSAAIVAANDPNTPQEEAKLLKMVLRLWVAIRITTRSTRICGDDTLDMSPDILDETSPLHGKIPIPPVMGAQIELILIQCIQTPLRKSVLDRLQSLIAANKSSTWYTRYLCLFILLHNCAMITKYDAGYAAVYTPERTYARPLMVEEYHLGANVLLAYWHYCNKGYKPFALGSSAADFHAISELNPYQTAFIRETSTDVQANEKSWKLLQQTHAYGNDYYFVSQLFEQDWKPRVSRII